jgi:hypothetical protein
MRWSVHAGKGASFIALRAARLNQMGGMPIQYGKNGDPVKHDTGYFGRLLALP